MLRRRHSIEPCLTRSAKEPPAGPSWIHEIKHDGFRILARQNDRGVRLFTRNGYDFTTRFPKIVEALANLGVRSCVIDGEAIVVDEHGLSVFDTLRYRLRDHAAARTTARTRSRRSKEAASRRIGRTSRPSCARRTATQSFAAPISAPRASTIGLLLVPWRR